MKRFLLFLAITATVVVLVLIGAVALVARSNTVHQAIIDQINKAIPGKFAIKRIAISLWLSRLKLMILCLPILREKNWQVYSVYT